MARTIKEWVTSERVKRLDNLLFADSSDCEGLFAQVIKHKGIEFLEKRWVYSIES